MRRIRQALYLKLQGLIGSAVESCYREFLSITGWSPAQLTSLTDRRLKELLRHAAGNVPYYRDRVGSQGVTDLRRFPILTKEEIRRSYFDLMTGELRRQHGQRASRTYSWIEVKTGGTTGVPTTVIHDTRLRDFGRAARLYSQSLCGFPFGTPYLRLWGSMSEINHMRDSLAQRISRRLANETLLNAFRMDEARMRSYLEVMRRSPARYLMAYVEAAAQLARFSRETGIEVRPLKGLAACAGTVTEETRTLLEQTFRCRVHNKYGSRECTDMACECDHGGMHVYTNHVVLEIVDETGEPVPAGSVGRILVTLLGNFSFPIIRYEIGDLGACREGACACGSPFPMLDRVVGRSAEVVRTPSGAQVLPVFIRHLIGVVHNPGIVRRFQFIQNSLTDCDLYLEVAASVPDTGYKPVVDRLQRDLAVVLGEDCVVRPQRVEHIPESANGKFQYVISRVAANPSRS